MGWFLNLMFHKYFSVSFVKIMLMVTLYSPEYMLALDSFAIFLQGKSGLIWTDPQKKWFLSFSPHSTPPNVWEADDCMSNYLLLRITDFLTLYILLLSVLCKYILKKYFFTTLSIPFMWPFLPFNIVNYHLIRRQFFKDSFKFFYYLDSGKQEFAI